MAHDVFISHSTRDKPVSDAVCAALENAGIRCWVAPRDVQPGRSFAGEITRAIQQSKAMVLIFSAHSNNSSQVLREVQLAVDSQLHILQFRIEEVLLNDDLKYYLSTPHWLDAMTPPLEDHLDHLARSLQVLLGRAPLEPPVSHDQRSAAAGALANGKTVALPGVAAAAKPSANYWKPALVTAAALATMMFLWIFVRERVPPKGGTEASALASVTSSTATPSAPTPTTRKPFDKRWDFSGGMLRDISSEGVEVVDASAWQMPGARHLRFVAGGQSRLAATFDVPGDTEPPTRLTVRHLSSSPDGKEAGYSPVRISLNGQRVFQGSPARIVWMEEQIDLGAHAAPGKNTLLWELLEGAQTHYWLKLFRLSSAPAALAGPAPASSETTVKIDFSTMAVGFLEQDAFAAHGVRALKTFGGRPAINDADPGMVLPRDFTRVLNVRGNSPQTSLVFEFDAPIRSFTVTRIGGNPTSLPTWTLEAYDSGGRIIDTVSQMRGDTNEPRIRAPATFTVRGSEISSVALAVDNRHGSGTWATYNCLPLAEIQFER